MTQAALPSLLRFQPAFFPRIWGGARLRDGFGWNTPDNQITGEAWLISDHPECVSIVADGPMAGVSLRWLMEHHAGALLGRLAAPTPQGRFPLLLKLIDAGDILSVQVHPDDATAEKLGESDAGKTEMWHVLEAAPEASLICGLQPGVDRERLMQAVRQGGCAELLVQFPAPEGASVFVPAGTVHAIGRGLLLAEIQQNSNITYRVYDWDRVDPQGNPRQLHVEQALASIHFDCQQTGPAIPLALPDPHANRTMLAACRYFAAEEILLTGTYSRQKGDNSFHLLMALSPSLRVRCGAEEALLNRGEAVLVTGAATAYQVLGPGRFLLYYVPNQTEDVYTPLRAAGHPETAIRRS